MSEHSDQPFTLQADPKMQEELRQSRRERHQHFVDLVQGPVACSPKSGPA